MHNKEKSFVSFRNERPGLAISTHVFVQLMSEGTLVYVVCTGVIGLGLVSLKLN